MTLARRFMQCEAVRPRRSKPRPWSRRGCLCGGCGHRAAVGGLVPPAADPSSRDLPQECSSRSSARPVPSATALSGSSGAHAPATRSPRRGRRSRPRRSAPPPASTRPRSTRSALKLGWASLQRHPHRLSTIVEIGSNSASRTSCEVTLSVFGRPATKVASLDLHGGFLLASDRRSRS